MAYSITWPIRLDDQTGAARRHGARALVLALIVAIGPGLAMIPIAGAAMQESVKQSMKYVDSLDDDCVYDHGYQCLEVSEDDFLGPAPDRDWVPGPYLEAWSACHRDFLAIPEMMAEQKRLRHYKIGFTENDTHYIILYQGLLLPMLEDGEVVGTMRATYGISTKYWINKETLNMDKRLFLR